MLLEKEILLCMLKLIVGTLMGLMRSVISESSIKDVAEEV